MTIPATVLYPFLKHLNNFVCRVMSGVTAIFPSPLSHSGSAILVSDYSTLGDPLVLLTTAGRPLQFLMAQEIYERWMIRWVFLTFQTIPVRRGSRNIRAIRTMMRVLDRAGVVVVFPEGGIDNFRDESGHLGVAYLAVKTGASIIPVLIRWAKNRPVSILGTLFVLGQVTVRYGEPLRFSQTSHPQRDDLEAITMQVMRCIKELSEAEYSSGGQDRGDQNGLLNNRQILKIPFTCDLSYETPRAKGDVQKGALSQMVSRLPI